jgi:hypothetical protein
MNRNKHTFLGGKYNKYKSNIDRIEDLCNDLIKKQKKLICIKVLIQLYLMKMPNIIPMNVHLIFEAMLKKIETKENENKLRIVSEHVPVSVSVFFNVPEYGNKPIFLCNSVRMHG